MNSRVVQVRSCRSVEPITNHPLSRVPRDGHSGVSRATARPGKRQVKIENTSLASADQKFQANLRERRLSGIAALILTNTCQTDNVINCYRLSCNLGFVKVVSLETT